MSIESLSSLSQLVEVMAQGQNIQLENLQGVQKAMQEVSTSEAQRKDNVHLEKAKAIYDKDVLEATKDKLNATLSRQKTSETVLGITALAVGGLTALDAVYNVGKDMFGFSMLNGDTSSDKKVGSFDKASTRLNEMSVSGQASTDSLLSDKNGNFAITHKNGDGSIGEDIRVGKVSSKQLQEELNGKGGFALVGDDGKPTSRAMALGIVQKKEGGKEGELELSKDAQKLGLTLSPDGKLDVSKVTDLSTLFKLDPEGAMAIAKKNSHSIGRNETGNFLSAIDNVGGLDKSLVRDALKSSGKGGDGLEEFGNALGRGGKSLFNGLIAMADATMPLFDAFMEMKSRVEETTAQLKTVEQKLAAAQKRLAQLEEIILNPGGSGLGNQFGGGAKAA